MGSIATTTLCKIGHLFMYFSSYKQGVSRLADLMATERGDPLQDAVWLLELVSETKGAEHLKLQSRKLNIFQAWLPDGYSQIFRSYVFGPSGFWTMAPLHYAAKFDPFLSLDCAPTPSTLAQSKERKGSNFAIWQPCRCATSSRPSSPAPPSPCSTGTSATRRGSSGTPSGTAG